MDLEKFKEELVDQAVGRVALFHCQHSIKCCLAIHRLLDRFPDWGVDAGTRLADTMGEEPPVDALGDRLPHDLDWGGDCRGILEKGLFAAAYVAMRNLVRDSSLDAVLSEYVDRACNDPEHLGHNVSILCAFLGMLPLLEGRDDRLGLFLDRLTEFVTAAFHNIQNRLVFDARPMPDHEPTQQEVLRAAFKQPGYFGHQLLTSVWSRRYRGQLGADGYSNAIRGIWETSHWEIPEKNRFSIEPTERPLDDERFAEAVRGLALHGPKNIHRVTLAEALVDLWDQAEDDATRARAFSAAERFSQSARPVATSA